MRVSRKILFYNFAFILSLHFQITYCVKYHRMYGLLLLRNGSNYNTPKPGCSITKANSNTSKPGCSIAKTNSEHDVPEKSIDSLTNNFTEKGLAEVAPTAPSKIKQNDGESVVNEIAPPNVTKLEVESNTAKDSETVKKEFHDKTFIISEEDGEIQEVGTVQISQNVDDHPQILEDFARPANDGSVAVIELEEEKQAQENVSLSNSEEIPLSSSEPSGAEEIPFKQEVSPTNKQANTVGAKPEGNSKVSNATSISSENQAFDIAISPASLPSKVNAVALNPTALLIVPHPSPSHIKAQTMPFMPRPKPTAPEFQFIHECGCQRQFFYKMDGFADPKLNSSCSDEGTRYVPGQKVISFSLPRGDGPNDFNRTTGSYRITVPENLHLMRLFYPGYSMRLYTDLQLDNTFCRILCQNSDIFWCDIRNSIGDQSKMIAPTWKFLPLGDPSVDLFLSRDISTFINEREAAAVEDWLQLNKTFHVMRDKRRAHNIPIMGGLWGARNDLLGAEDGDKLRTMIISLSKTPRSKGYKPKNFDQDILSRVIFYPKKKEIVAYDSYHCRQWKKFTMVRPFPTRRNNTVTVQEIAMKGTSAAAAVAAIRKKYKLTKCPVECRPSYGKDWEYC